MVTQPSEADYRNPELKPYIEKYLKGVASVPTEDLSLIHISLSCLISVTRKTPARSVPSCAAALCTMPPARQAAARLRSATTLTM